MTRLSLMIAALAAMAAPAQAQTVIPFPGQSDNGIPLPEIPQSQTQVQRDRVSAAGAAVVRALDKLTGRVEDLSIARGETAEFGRIQVTLGDCRFPTDNPAGDAYAFLVVREAGVEQPAFGGWMIASSPALNAMEHPRYDVWVMRCSN